jgi:hypothetical protein
MRLRYDNKRDENEAEIVVALRAAGCSVELDGANGRPDLLVGLAGRTYQIEVKNPNVQKSDQKLTKLQAPWHRDWQGHKCVVYDIEGALIAVGLKNAPSPAAIYTDDDQHKLELLYGKN